MPIKKLLRIILILFSIIPASIISILTYSYVEKALMSSRKEDLHYLLSNSASQISSTFDAQIYELNLQSARWIYPAILHNYQEDGTLEKSINYSSAISTSLSALLSRYSYCCSYRLYDTSGQILINASIPSLEHSFNKEEILYPALKNKSSSSTSFSSSSVGHQNYIHLTKPIVLDNELLGYITSTIKTSYFEYIFKTYPVGKTGETLLVNKGGSILYAKKDSLINTTLNDPAILSILANNNLHNIETFTHLYNGQEYLFATLPIEDTNWSVLIKQETSEIVGNASIILYALLACFFVIFILTYFASNLFARYYTAPIFKLREMMKKVSNGDFSARCMIESKNEVGDLAKSFNKMIQIIQTSYDDLSSMHEQLMDNEEEIRSNYNHIEYLAYHDLLTNLPNKLFFLEKVDMMFALEEDSKLMHAIYFIDLDNFKTINDTLGHDFGDEILSATGKKLTSLVNERDLVSRVGGDEFLLFKYDVSSEKHAYSFAQTLIKAFSHPFLVWEETIHISISIGISIYPIHGKTHKTLIKNADIAMYESKEHGKNRVSIFNPSMSDEIFHNAEILEILRTVIEKQEVYLEYQPQVDIDTNRIVGYEALMRINSQKLGFLSPKDFIPIAEDSELIVPLGEWALKEACRFNKSIIDSGKTPCPVSVNVSSIQLNKPGFIKIVQDILNETNLPACYLELEITESTLISSLVDTISILRKFKEMGVLISLDDFGTGYSSLKYLTTLPITTLKIDKSFIDNVCTNEKDTYIAKSIISLAHNINIKVIAEGVEYKEQYELLKSENCDIIQGFLFSRPVLPRTLLTLLDTPFLL